MKEPKAQVSITIDEDVLMRLRQLSEADERSLSQYINRILKEHIKQVKERE
ncbi:ribbon-helix-helix protein, CopG family [Blautia schinkii]|nr:ribbon-helix-helix protein, CopG family [Blautia schinkii]